MGGVAATQKIPYIMLSESHHLLPRSLLAFLFGSASIGNAEFSPYFGVMPLLLAGIGAWRNWEQPWVKYFTGLGLVAFFYSMGSYSFLHGLLYLLVPFLDMAREAGRFIYLTHFAMALLAGFGVETLFPQDALAPDSFSKLARILQRVVIITLLALGIPAVYGRPEINEWLYVPLISIIASSAVFLHIARGNRTWRAQFLLVAVILSDLHVFNWTIHQSKLREERKGSDHLAQLQGTKKLADFFKSKPGLFRIHFQGDWPPNRGDMFGVQTTGGTGVTTLKGYTSFLTTLRGLDLLNVRYIASKEGKAPDMPVFDDGTWKVYENPSYCPRGWVVSGAFVEPSEESVLDRIQEEGFDPSRVAFVNRPLELDFAREEPIQAQVVFDSYLPDRLQLTTTADRPGLLVLSEVYYPGWKATVNGKSARIYKVNGLLRGIVVTEGTNQIVLQYQPRPFRVGALLTALALGGTCVFAVILLGRKIAGNA